MSIQGHVDLISRTAITGWAIDWNEPASPLDIAIIVDGVEAGRCKADIQRQQLAAALGGNATGAHEFQFRLPRPLDTFDQHNVEVWAAGRQLLPNGRRTLYPERSGTSRFTPILLTSTGRSGTTMLMQEFAEHPQVAVANIYPFEVKLLSYYAAAWTVLSASTYLPNEREHAFGFHASRDMLIGRNPWNRPDLLNAVGGRQAARLIGKTFPDRLADLFRSTIEEHYAGIADKHGGNSGVHCFAEKSVLEEPVRRAARTLFGTVKEIVMVRDPRDYLCSASKFWRHDIPATFAAMRSDFAAIMDIRREENADVAFVRYEDMILDPTSSRRQIYDFLGCDAHFEPHTAEQPVVPDAHRTSRSPAESIGRFRSELDADVLRECAESFGPFMRMFGYPA